METTTMRRLSISSLALALAGSIGTCIGYVHAKNMLAQDFFYQNQANWENVEDHIDDAIGNLAHRNAYTTFISCGKAICPIYHPERKPDPSYARGNLSNAIGT